MKPGKAGAPAGVILMTADKGLAGAFNANVIRAAELFARDRRGRRWYTGRHQGAQRRAPAGRRRPPRPGR